MRLYVNIMRSNSNSHYEVDFFEKKIFVNARKSKISFRPYTIHSTTKVAKSQSPVSTKGQQQESILNELVSYSYACVIRDAINKLLILNSIYKKDVDNIDYEPQIYRTLKDRFSIVEDDFHNLKLNFTFTIYEKLTREITEFNNLLENVCTELILQGGTYKVLVKYLNTGLRLRDDEINLSNHFNVNKQQISDLRKALEEDKIKFKFHESRLKNNIQFLRQKLEKQTVKKYVANAYVFEWEKARVQQHLEKTQRKELVYENIIDELNIDCKREESCHQNIEKLVEEITQEYSDKIQEWINKYDHDFEMKEEKLAQLKLGLSALEREIDQMMRIFNERQIYIDEWNKIKRENLLREWAALKIQSWWRGVMVRKQLGVYALKKPKRKNRNKNKK